MDRLISEKYLIEHLKACFENGRPMFRPTLDEVLEMIKAIPSAEPKTGHWITEDRLHPKCDQCGWEYGSSMTNFCPNCGARMIEPQE